MTHRIPPVSSLLCLVVVFSVAACGDVPETGAPEVDPPENAAGVSPPAEEEQVPEVEESYIQEMEELAADPRIQEAFSIIEDLEEWTVQRTIEITEIPAPPFMEDERAEAYAQMIQEVGIDEVYRDEEGNVIGVRHGATGDRRIVVSGHLDTVFPEGTDVTVEVRGDTLFAPGVGDDSRGLAVVLTVLRAMNEAGVDTDAEIWFVGTVGEEGLGDLRGVKHLFRDGGPEIDAFISVDGGGMSNVVNQALGSRRYRVTFEGPGGHSWGAFGLGNPAHTLGRAILRFDEAAAEFVATGPRTSYNVGRIGGGTSVNSIPYEAWMEVDMRSIDHERLLEIDALFNEVMDEALQEYLAAEWDGEPVTLDLDMVGDRPSGEIPQTDPFVQRAMASVAFFGEEPSLGRSSTDSNVPISLGIPSVTVGRGGAGGGTHSLDEWWANEDQHLAIQRTLLLVVAEAGLAP